MICSSFTSREITVIRRAARSEAALTTWRGISTRQMQYRRESILTNFMELMRIRVAKEWRWQVLDYLSRDKASKCLDRTLRWARYHSAKYNQSEAHRQTLACMIQTPRMAVRGVLQFHWQARWPIMHTRGQSMEDRLLTNSDRTQSINLTTQSLLAQRSMPSNRREIFSKCLIDKGQPKSM